MHIFSTRAFPNQPDAGAAMTMMRVHPDIRVLVTFDQHARLRLHLCGPAGNAQHGLMVNAPTDARVLLAQVTFPVMVPRRAYGQREPLLATARLAIVLVVGIVLMQVFDVISTIIAMRMGL